MENAPSKTNAAWKDQKGERRLMAEFRSLSKTISNQPDGQLQDLELVNDSLRNWQLKVKNFDQDVPGGRQLNQDLAELQRNHGMDHILLEVLFPEDYPNQPPFVRVVAPRCQYYTGHVTAGGEQEELLIWSGMLSLSF